MKISSIIKLAALTAAVVFVGCAQPVSTGNGVTTVRADISGQVLDNMGVPLEGVEISYAAPSRAINSVKTNKEGFYFISGLVTGEYYLTYKYSATVNNVTTSYLTLRKGITVPSLAQYLAEVGNNNLTSLGWSDLGSKDGYVVFNRVNQSMLPLTGTVKGTLLMRSSTQAEAAAVPVNAKTIRYYINDSIPGYVETVTGVDGTFSFTSFPLGLGLTGSIQVLLGDSGTAISQVDTSYFEEVYAPIPNGVSTYYATASKPVELGTLIAAPQLTTFRKVSSNVDNANDNNTNVTNFAVDGVIKYTFSKDVTGWTSASLLAGGVNLVDATFAVDATDKKVLNVTPSKALFYGTSYTVYIDGVTSGVPTDLPLSINDTFTTAKTTLTAPVVAFDDAKKLKEEALDANNDGRTTYQSGENNVYISYNILPNVNGSAVAYAAEYMLAGATTWSNATLTPTAVNGTTQYATVTNFGGLDSGEVISIRIKATHAGASDVVSNVLTLEDKVAPTSATIAGAAWSNNSSALTATTSTLVAPTATVDGYLTFTIVLGEDTGIPTVTPFTGSTLVSTKLTSATTAEVILKIAKTATFTLTGKAVDVTLVDKAGNAVADYDIGTANAQTKIVLTF